MSSGGLQAVLSEIFGQSQTHQPAQAEQRNHRDDALRDDAIKAPHLEDVLLDVGRWSAKPRPTSAGMQTGSPRRRTTPAGQQQIAGDADRRHRNVDDDMEKVLWFTMPQSHCALMSQGSVLVE